MQGPRESSVTPTPTAEWQPDLTKCSEVPSAGCGALASIQQKDLGQAQQKEHGTQHHHALFELHVHTDRPRPPPHPMLCVVPAVVPFHPWCMAPVTPSGPPSRPVCPTGSSEKQVFHCFSLEATVNKSMRSPTGEERDMWEGLQDRGRAETREN